MNSVPIEKLLSVTENSLYKLVILVSRRAIEIAEGSPKLVEVSPSLKPASIALREIMEGKIGCKKRKAS
ncbi:MAG: DNA-directed RNA polymerase subunit omega [Candidatus Omnitrophica bacterium CG11_big_fil_rev_8_21_14_0_20_42_13]|uniref:DNA-directed RNA polymerase subunit omega n=1 Tax=Candidatus Ghiorseimicrobium undicola TaxID=1974746 RepID=A0A2H0LXT4_9BACT|nr:MAG: DNA-directed RNA polymerase subunit omega [Candidatus Omnitrophica bacterium CG11_big_fil_rev_8_21_14_0_20_42_13]